MTYPHGGAAEIWRDGTGQPHRPVKPEIRDWGTFLQGQITAIDVASNAPARYMRDTLADLQAVAAPEANAVGFVLSDPAHRGTFQFDGSAWGRVADLPLSLLSVQILDGEDGNSAVISDAPHPWLHMVRYFAALMFDPSQNAAVGIDAAGDVWAANVKLLESLEMEGFKVSRQTTEHAFALGDNLGHLGFAIKRDGAVLLADGSSLHGVLSDWEFAVVDADLNVGFGIKDGVFRAPGVTGQVVDLTKLDARNKGHSQGLRETFSFATQLPTATYSTIASYGQSLGEGYETWPSLSKSPVPGALMIGDNVDNISESDAYAVIGSAVFNPLVANTHNGTANLTGAEEAALSPGDQARGEPPVIGLTNGLKLAMNRRALASDDGRSLVAISAAIGGKTIEQLSKTNTQDGVDRYGILMDGIADSHALAGGDHVVPLVAWTQGEWNYRDFGGSWDKATYASLMGQLFDDIVSDVAGITGQDLPPLFLTYQTGGSYTRDVDSAGVAGLHVGMAQLEVALAREDTAMVGPVYPYTDKGGHLDANGSRWYGHLLAKVARHVQLEGRSWEPLRPLEVTAVAAEVFVSFHVPVPPLVFDLPYVASVANDYADKGFRVTSADGLTEYDITAVDIVADTVVRLQLASPPPANALVWYADKSVHDGNGNLRDSDRSLASETYEYVPDRGMYPAANIPDLVDKPYPLANWAIAFCLSLNHSEFD